MKTATSKQPRPKIKIELSLTDRFIEAISIMLIFGMWVMAFWNFMKLPETIPVHINATGNIDGYGNKLMVFFIPVIATVTYVTLLILSRFPHVYNYPLEVTEQTAPRVYAFSVRMIRTLNLGIVVMFTVTEYMIIKMANGISERLTIWIILMFCLLTVVFLIYSINKLFRLGKGV